MMNGYLVYMFKSCYITNEWDERGGCGKETDVTVIRDGVFAVKLLFWLIHVEEATTNLISHFLIPLSITLFPAP